MLRARGHGAQTGDTIAMSPPLIVESKQIARIVETLAP